MRVLIACSMLENEIRMILDRLGLKDLMVVWMERGYHDRPEELGHVVQEEIDKAEDLGADEILLCYGLCGNGAEGWTAKRAKLVMPKFDDCINMLLCPGRRSKRNLIESGRFYLTEGWCNDKSSLGQMVEDAIERYGERRGLRVMKQMLSSYHHITIIDTGCYDIGPVRDYAGRCAERLGFEVDEVKGSCHVIEKLLAGIRDDDILVKEPGNPVRISDFGI